jgi:hypothetical protein
MSCGEIIPGCFFVADIGSLNETGSIRKHLKALVAHIFVNTMKSYYTNDIKLLEFCFGPSKFSVLLFIEISLFILLVLCNCYFL